jgi:rod shape-determining protein MreD
MAPAERRRFWLGHWRLAVPVASVLVLMLVMLAPLPLGMPAMPPLMVLAVLIWGIFQPGLMAPWLAFALGLVADGLMGQPWGANAVQLALVAVLVRGLEGRFRQRPHRRDWLVAALVLALAMLLEWLLMTLAGRPVPLRPMLWQWLTGVLAYPPLVALFAGLQRWLLGRAAGG